MRPLPNKKIDKCRVSHPMIPEQRTGDFIGTYRFNRPGGTFLFVIATIDNATNGQWEHASVVAHDHDPNGPPTNRTPTWDEMCFVKRQFWDPQEVVYQVHPAESEYVNVHESCLHLWKPVDREMLVPPSVP